MTDPARLPALIAAAPILDALARTRSFTDAANELGLTQSAVSHRLRAIEEAFGVTLFDRTTRSVTPTEEGILLAQAADTAVQAFRRSIASIERAKRGNSLRITASFSLVNKWLMQRLDALQEACPFVELALVANDRPADLEAGEADVAIRFGARPPAGLHATFLGRDKFFPVARPGVVEGPLNRQGLYELLSKGVLADRLSESDRSGCSWRAWAVLAGLPAEGIHSGQSFDRADLMIQAAIAGNGVALGRLLLVEDDIERGFLSPDIGPVFETEGAYWFVCPEELANGERVQSLREWLVSAFRETLSRNPLDLVRKAA